MATDVPTEAIELHNDMVLNVGQQITPMELEDLKHTFLNNPLTIAQIHGIKTVQELFTRLKSEKVITFGDYKRLESYLKLINPDLCSIVSKCTTDIGNIRKQEDIGRKQSERDETDEEKSKFKTIFERCMKDPQRPTKKQLEDKGIIEYGVEFTKAVKEDADLGRFKALFQSKDFEFPVDPLLIIAAYGSPAAVEYVHKWSSPALNWNELLEIKFGVFEGILDKMKDSKTTPLYVATFMKKLETVGTLIKYADDMNIAYCMNNIELSNPMEIVYMTEVGERLKREYSDLKPAVVPGHQKEADGTWGRVFIVYSPDVMRAANHVKEGIGLVMVRNPYKVDREAVTVSESKDADCGISKQDMERTKQAIASHSKTLWCNHSNLNIISVSPMRSKRKGAVLEKSLCVVLYCSTKGVVPVGETEFPTRLPVGEGNYIDVDVREGYFEYGGYETRPSANHHQILKMGCNIGVMATPVPNSGGTLGPFVKYKGSMGFLTCAHVLFDIGQQNTVDFTDTVSPSVHVVQPAADASCPSGAACGFVQRAIFDPSRNPSIDVALVTISDPKRTPTKGRFANDHSHRYRTAGFDDLPEYNNGSVLFNIERFGGSNMVVKFGSETHLTKGNLIVNGTQVRPLSTALGLPSCANTFCMTNQYEVEGTKSTSPFFLLGDSGSAVFMMYGTSLHCIGMAIGIMSNGNAVVTPIGALLNALGSSVELANFEDSSQQPYQCSVA